MSRRVCAVDLFCGAGGSSSGLVDFCQAAGRRVDLLAINHWSVAIATHERNLPGVRHLCADVASVDPRAAVLSGRLDFLWASPECKFHSTARGGRPINDQQRADPWQVCRWLSELYVRSFLIENVPEFRAWGPLDARDRPLKRRRGETYQAFLGALRGLGYTVEARLLNAADYGDPTTRRRLFIAGRRDGRPIHWPEPTHGRPGNLLGLAPWRTAREDVIDWSILGESIFGRRRPLARSTIARIIAGALRYWRGELLEPFLVVLRGTDPEQLRRSPRPLTLPLPAVCAGGTHLGLAQGFLLGQQSGGAPRPVSAPVPTVATTGAIAVVAPLLVPRYSEREGQRPRTHSIDAPMPTVPASNQHALVEGFILPPLGVHHRDGKANRPRSVDEPLQTVTASRGGGHLVEPFLVHVNHGDNARGSGRGNGGRTRGVSAPLPTVTGSRGLALIEAMIAKYYRSGICRPVTAPLDAVTTKDRFALVMAESDGVALDIRFRMLTPDELARAQGLGDFTFVGTREQQVRQIGNAVPRNLARALCQAMLT